ncbi:MAG TPA: squalene--hopene cyclase [Verrucomicrobiales bacterium]|nr:squalene--hopene cyclase [Verrucomicrobiales bacterium]
MARTPSQPVPSDPAKRIDRRFSARLEAGRRRAINTLLAARNPAGHWVGELSSSALSTATAICALSLYSRHHSQLEPADRHEISGLIELGFKWLASNVNSDGGWGDTIRSFSNISTTTLVWAAFAFAPPNRPLFISAARGAEKWLSTATGGVTPDRLVPAIEARYGDDRTFSIPILTMCALAGRLGDEESAWRRVRQLPFELAALPHRWFGALRLPVVSYALPALIAIGQVRHHFRPTRNPLTRIVRALVADRTLEVLKSVQPLNGGFLEATPLTSFVTMSLAAMGLTGHLVVERGVSFLRGSAQPDGSWQIDTNLATWLTTLSINALGESIKTGCIDDTGRRELRSWLLQQQYRVKHPYTNAAPGGWAWTDLPGGVPDADDTAGALLALHQLDPRAEETTTAAHAGAKWLLGVQNSDGGIPTFCRGWGRLPFDRSSPDLTAHAIRAWSVWRSDSGSESQKPIEQGTRRALNFLVRNQRPDGSWVPLWFGHQESPDDENPLYGTARVLHALAGGQAAFVPSAASARDRGLHWLISAQKGDGGWSGAAKGSSTVEETSLAVEALAELLAAKQLESSDHLNALNALVRGAEWLLDALESSRESEPSPIGFYFAKLWYFERLYPLIFATAALVKVDRLLSGK